MLRTAGAIAALCALLAACGSSGSAPASTVAASATSLAGCHALPLDGSAYRSRGIAQAYMVSTTSSRICFATVRRGSRCVRAPGLGEGLSNPITSANRPHPGGYTVIVDLSGHSWSFSPGCP